MRGRIEAFTAVYLVALVICMSGCKTIWTHPQATQERYTRDLTGCRTLTRTPWATCMKNLGWDYHKGLALQSRINTDGGTGKVMKSWQAMLAAEGNDLRPPTWVNPSLTLTGPARDKEFARVKADCIERAYVGQSTTGHSSGRIGGGGSVFNGSGSSFVGGRAESTANSQPAFNDELFEACMSAEGWNAQRQ